MRCRAQLIVGTDSHTPHSGALGCVAFGVGTTDMANAFVTGAVRLTMPAVLRVELDGPLPPASPPRTWCCTCWRCRRSAPARASARCSSSAASAVRAMSIDERATLTNMMAELGGFTGIVEPDDETVRFLQASAAAWTFASSRGCASDAGAAYADDDRHRLHARCRRWWRRPATRATAWRCTTLAERPQIDIAYGGSCTAGKREDFDHYHAVLRWAADRGLRVADGVKLYLQFGTVDVRDHCIAQGYLAAFDAVGAEILQPACGACANCGPGASTDAEQVTVSAINRNFPGRSGPGQVWLASPPTVAASAIAGELASFDELQRRFARWRNRCGFGSALKSSGTRREQGPHGLCETVPNQGGPGARRAREAPPLALAR